ncbi:MAG: hypothetical protein M1553_11945, partial [Firmicutes bacterium]|nr:hypothetical protein [Bacillota bacterium]
LSGIALVSWAALPVKPQFPRILLVEVERPYRHAFVPLVVNGDAPPGGGRGSCPVLSYSELSLP